jgi:hypothetical protein
VEMVMKVIAESGLWARKQAFKEKYRSKWYERLVQALVREGVTWEFATLLAKQKTLRSVAIYITAEKYKVEYDTVVRGLSRRGVKPDKNSHTIFVRLVGRQKRPK